MAANDIKQAIIARVEAHGLNDLIGLTGARRFYSMAAPPDADVPWVAMQRIGGTGVYGGGTDKRAPETDFLFRIGADSTSSLEAVQQQLLDCFDGWTDASIAGVHVDKVRVLNDGIDEYDEGSETYWTVMILQFGWVV